MYLVDRCDGIMYQRHVNKLRHNREVSPERTEKSEERFRVVNDIIIIIGMKGLIDKIF